MKIIKNILDRTPMYRLVIYALLTVVATTLVESFFLVQPYTFESQIVSLILFLVLCIGINFVFTKFLKLPFQFESSTITALILFLVILPGENVVTFISIMLASFFAIASKYILRARNTHIFNPAAFGIFSVTFLGYFFNFASSFWWVGSLYTLPVVLLAGLIVVKKTKREIMFVTAILSGIVGSVISSYFFNMDLMTILKYTFISGPIIFFAAFMITEPHTIAKTKTQQILYSAFIILLPILFVLSSTFVNIFNIPPELSLLIANLLFFVISQRRRYVLKLKSIEKLSDDIYEYVFSNTDSRSFFFRAGEFLEWNLYHKNADDRGMRRYFTISSRPNLHEVSFATKFPIEKESSFKKALKEIKIGDTVYASQLSGEFVLPKIKVLNTKNIIMIAGGIGITPFISQLKDLMAKNETKKQIVSITLFYCVKFSKDIVYLDFLKKAIDELGIKVVCVISENSPGLPLQGEQTSPNLFFETGYLTKELLNKYTQNLHNEFFISGPSMMVVMLKNILTENKVNSANIHTDYFPGY